MKDAAMRVLLAEVYEMGQQHDAQQQERSCIFFDADRYSAPAQLALLISKLAPDVLLLAENVLSHPNEIAGYLNALEALPRFDRVIVPIGKGLSVAYRSAAG